MCILVTEISRTTLRYHSWRAYPVLLDYIVPRRHLRWSCNVSAIKPSQTMRVHLARYNHYNTRPWQILRIKPMWMSNSNSHCQNQRRDEPILLSLLVRRYKCSIYRRITRKVHSIQGYAHHLLAADTQAPVVGKSTAGPGGAPRPQAHRDKRVFLRRAQEDDLMSA